ncbi:MAG: phosphopantetheine-binding protein [Hyphomicrobiales bacterium]|nr:MAG: phosphopantetheine-binding protein [Hyphomicrobiales bacterium]
MTLDDDTIFQEVRRLLQPFNAKNIELSLETDMTTDMQIDSVSVMDFIMEVEDRFDIDIPLNLLADTRTLQELVTVIRNQIDKS